MNEIEIYEMVAAEIDSGHTKSGLWAKSFAESDGDENRTRALYMRLRVAQVIEENDRNAAIESERAELEAKKSAERLAAAEAEKMQIFLNELQSEKECLKILRQNGFEVNRVSWGNPMIDNLMDETRWRIVSSKNNDVVIVNGSLELKNKTVELLTKPIFEVKPSAHLQEKNELPISFQSPEQILDMLISRDITDPDNAEYQEFINQLSEKLLITGRKKEDLSRLITSFLSTRSKRISKAKSSLWTGLPMLIISTVFAILSNRSPLTAETALAINIVALIQIVSWGFLLHALWCWVTSPSKISLLNTIKQSKSV